MAAQPPVSPLILIDIDATMPAGVINGPPYSQKGMLQLPITVEGRLSDPEQFSQIVIKRDNAGVITRLEYRSDTSNKGNRDGTAAGNRCKAFRYSP